MWEEFEERRCYHFVKWSCWRRKSNLKTFLKKRNIFQYSIEDLRVGWNKYLSYGTGFCFIFSMSMQNPHPFPIQWIVHHNTEYWPSSYLLLITSWFHDENCCIKYNIWQLFPISRVSPDMKKYISWIVGFSTHRYEIWLVSYSLWMSSFRTKWMILFQILIIFLL